MEKIIVVAIFCLFHQTVSLPLENLGSVVIVFRENTEKALDDLKTLEADIQKLMQESCPQPASEDETLMSGLINLHKLHLKETIEAARGRNRSEHVECCSQLFDAVVKHVLSSAMDEVEKGTVREIEALNSTLSRISVHKQTGEKLLEILENVTPGNELSTCSPKIIKNSEDCIRRRLFEVTILIYNLQGSVDDARAASELQRTLLCNQTSLVREQAIGKLLDFVKDCIKYTRKCLREESCLEDLLDVDYMY